MAQINIRVEDEVKASEERTLNDIGMSMSTAINVFLKTVAREHRYPLKEYLSSSTLFYLSFANKDILPRRHHPTIFSFIHLD